MRVTDEMVEAAYSAWQNAVRADRSMGNREAIRDALEAALALSHAAGQDGEQCRAASGESRRLDVYVGSDGWKARPLEERLRIHAEDCERCADERTDAVLSAFQIRAMHDDLHEALRALSRGVPEGETVPKILMRAVKAANSAGAESLADDILSLMDTHWPTSDAAIAAQRKEVSSGRE